MRVHRTFFIKNVFVFQCSNFIYTAPHINQYLMPLFTLQNQGIFGQSPPFSSGTTKFSSCSSVLPASVGDATPVRAVDIIAPVISVTGEKARKSRKDYTYNLLCYHKLHLPITKIKPKIQNHFTIGAAFVTTKTYG